MPSCGHSDASLVSLASCTDAIFCNAGGHGGEKPANAGQGSLDQVRYSLEGIIGLMAPKLGLPEAYEALRAGEN